MCRDQYGAREEILNDEKRQVSEDVKDSEMQLQELEKAKAEADRKLSLIREKINANQTRIDQLRNTNAASETELTDVQAMLDDISRQEEEMRRAQMELENEQDSQDLNEQIQAMAKKEQELEELLFALET